LDDLAWEDQLALELLADPVTSEAALELAWVQNSAAHRWGWAGGSGQGQQFRAENCFQEAEAALARGDRMRAAEKAREGRRLVAQGIQMAGGPGAIVGMVERLEALPSQVAADPGAFANSGKLGLQIGKVAERARAALRSGDPIGAGALGVLGEQAFRHNHRYEHEHRIGASRAEIAVALGAEAVELAKRLLQAQVTADTESQQLLATAEEFLAQARRALEAGEEVRAMHLAHLAQWWALKAVVLPGGVSHEEVREILGLAETLLEQAREAIGPEPTQLQAALLDRALRLLERGKEGLGSGERRGLGALWQSAVISSYLVAG
jgi:hypothetical protein